MAKQRFYHFDVPIEKTKLYDIPALEKAKQIIEMHPSEHFFISTLAEKVGLNEFKLKVGFRELFKISPYKYLVQLRLQQAKALLEDTDLTINEIADSVGFKSYNGFSTKFKKVYKISPTHYRKMA
ncbi:MAG TPA: AraC family transcriptional regulator [Puia sp.]